MKLNVYAGVCFVLLFAATGYAKDSKPASQPKAHIEAPSHDHMHGNDCGHKVVPHGKHSDFIHDGHYHAPHGTHYDEHGSINASAESRVPSAAKDDSHVKHAGHKHKHGDKCGHQAVQHDDHTDFIHDGHFHASHNGHIDDHGSVLESEY